MNEFINPHIHPIDYAVLHNSNFYCRHLFLETNLNPLCNQREVVTLLWVICPHLSFSVVSVRLFFNFTSISEDSFTKSQVLLLRSLTHQCCAPQFLVLSMDIRYKVHIFCPEFSQVIEINDDEWILPGDNLHFFFTKFILLSRWDEF